MKAFIKYSAFITLAVAILGFILMLACPGISAEGESISGAKAIFGYSEGFAEFKGTPIAIVAFVLVILALVILLAKILLPLLKVDAISKFDKILSIVVGCALVLAGVLLFFTKTSWLSANGLKEEGLEELTDLFKLGAGIIISAILYIAAGVVALIPSVLGSSKTNE